MAQVSPNWIALAIKLYHPTERKRAIVYANPALGYVAEVVPHTDFLEIYHEVKSLLLK